MVPTSHKVATGVVSRVRVNLSNSFALLLLLVEWLQLTALTFNPAGPLGEDAHSIASSLPAVLLTGDSFSSSLLEVTVAVVVVVSVGWVFVNEISISLSPGSFPQAVVCFFLAPILLGPLYMPALVHIFTALSCSYSPRRHALYLDASLVATAVLPSSCAEADPNYVGVRSVERYYTSEILWDEPSASDKLLGSEGVVWSLCGALPCWEAIDSLELTQTMAALVALYGLVLYLPSAATFTHPSYFVDPDLDLTFTPHYNFVTQLVKAILVYLAVTFPRWPTLVLVIHALSLILLVLYARWRQPAGAISFLYLRCGGFLIGAWSAVANLITLHILHPPGKDATIAPEIVLICGWGLVGLACVAAYIKLHHSRARAKLVPTGDDAEDTVSPDEPAAGMFTVSGTLERHLKTKPRWFDIPDVSAPPAPLVAPRIRLGELTQANQDRVAGLEMAQLAMDKKDRPKRLPPVRVTPAEAGGDSKQGPPPGTDPRWRETETLDLSYQELGLTTNRGDLATTLREATNVRKLLLASNMLTSLRTAWLPLLVHLDLANNQIASFNDLPKAPSLQTIDLSQNRITASVAAVKHMRRYKRLTSLCLRGNPVAFSPEYRALVRSHAPRSLTTLDEKPLELTQPPPDAQPS
mmetsp:Transcript_60570/g.131447  ORF Transcript_60570/g.131447 Transcript_60570/m.131447 type:complete len:638 (+) Transcript_60570:2-1915(+)